MRGVRGTLLRLLQRVRSEQRAPPAWELRTQRAACGSQQSHRVRQRRCLHRQHAESRQLLRAREREQRRAVVRAKEGAVPLRANQVRTSAADQAHAGAGVTPPGTRAKAAASERT